MGGFVSNQISNNLIDQVAQVAKNSETLLFLCDNETSERGLEGTKTTALKLLEKHQILASIGKLPLGNNEKIDPAQWIRDQWPSIQENLQIVWEMS